MRSIQACEHGDWSIMFWPIGAPEQRTVIPFRCRSWRHSGECCEWKASQDISRICAGISKHSHWLYSVLTYAQQDWPDKKALYRAGVVHWSRLRKRIIREWGPLAYIQTWEKHAKGGAHVNVLFNCERMYEACKGDGWKDVRRNWLEPNAVACGFGFRTWLEPLRDADAMGAYLVKLARELTDRGGKSQIPVDAPWHFRRIRASQGLLPPPYKNPDLTGRMCFTPDAVARWAYQVADGLCGPAPLHEPCQDVQSASNVLQVPAG